MPGVYISYPFCSQKCTFCNFASGVSSADTVVSYHAALLRQIASFHWPWTPDTLYFGGGTPSLMPLDFLGEVIAGIPQSALIETTLEAAPGTLTPERVDAWRVAGVNRVSLGVQSFVDIELRQIGRRHNAERVARDVELLRAAGIVNFNIDLIAGLPGQTRESWRRSLECLARLNPPHVSIYTFEVDEESRLGNEILLGGARYGAALVPADDLVAEFYEAAVTALQAMGLARYEISNFAAAGWESRHNLKYWQLEPYVGFGLDAHSCLDGVRLSTSGQLSEYIEVPAFLADRVPANQDEETFFVGLRLEKGIAPTPLQRARFALPIARWTETGLLIDDGGRLRLSPSGILVSNEILQDFVLTEAEYA